MARINTKGMLSGTVGNYSFRVLNGKAIVQSKPGRNRVKQTAATKSSASEFGTANTLARQVREMLYPLLQDLSDSKMYNRFATALYGVLLGCTSLPKGKRTLLDGNLEDLAHFEFNSASPFSKYCRVQVQAVLDGQGQIRITTASFNSRQNVAQVETATDAILVFLVTAFDPHNGEESYSKLFQCPFRLDGNAIAAQEWTTAALREGQVAIASAALFYYRGNNLVGPVRLNSKQLHPSAILKAFAWDKEEADSPI